MNIKHMYHLQRGGEAAPRGNVQELRRQIYAFFVENATFRHFSSTKNDTDFSNRLNFVSFLLRKFALF